MNEKVLKIMEISFIVLCIALMGLLIYGVYDFYNDYRCSNLPIQDFFKDKKCEKYWRLRDE